MDNNILKNHYENYDEDNRLVSKHGSVEYLTTMKYVHKYLKKGMKILEVGAATGRYSIALYNEGFDVTAIELVEHHINIFKSKLKDDDTLRVEQGDALDLSRFNDESFDVVLILGPMYHLYNKIDKVKALNEAKRVTKKNGLIFVAYCMNEATIITWAFEGDGSNLLYCLENNMLTKDFKCISEPKDIFEMVRIEDINSLNELVNIKREEIIATDLYTNYMKEQIENWSDEIFNIYLKYHFTICDRQDLIGISHHTLDILRKA